MSLDVCCPSSKNTSTELQKVHDYPKQLKKTKTKAKRIPEYWTNLIQAYIQGLATDKVNLLMSWSKDKLEETLLNSKTFSSRISKTIDDQDFTSEKEICNLAGKVIEDAQVKKEKYLYYTNVRNLEKLRITQAIQKKDIDESRMCKIADLVDNSARNLIMALSRATLDHFPKSLGKKAKSLLKNFLINSYISEYKLNSITKSVLTDIRKEKRLACIKKRADKLRKKVMTKIKEKLCLKLYKN